MRKASKRAAQHNELKERNEKGGAVKRSNRREESGTDPPVRRPIPVSASVWARTTLYLMPSMAIIITGELDHSRSGNFEEILAVHL